MPDHTYPEYIPEPDDFPFSSMEPMPVVAKRGQALIFTQSNPPPV